MRAAEEARRAAAYGPITVRAILPDGHVLQATFQVKKEFAQGEEHRGCLPWLAGLPWPVPRSSSRAHPSFRAPRACCSTWRQTGAGPPAQLRAPAPAARTTPPPQAAHPLSKLRGVVRRAVGKALGERVFLYTTPPKAVLKDLDLSFYQVHRKCRHCARSRQGAYTCSGSRSLELVPASCVPGAGGLLCPTLPKACWLPCPALHPAPRPAPG